MDEETDHLPTSVQDQVIALRMQRFRVLIAMGIVPPLCEHRILAVAAAPFN